MSSMKIFFDVGAHEGTDSIPLAKSNPDALFYAFEPNPHMVAHLKKETKDLSNYIIIEKAVSDFNGKSNFNICKLGPTGVSSLLEFSKTARTNWRGFFLSVDEKIEVDVIRLDSFIEENNISSIEYLHVDTQGSDLKVLNGLGKYLSIVKQGQVEAAVRPESLYVNQNTYQDTMSFLTNNGFDIVKIDAEGGMRECNIKFKKFDLSFSI